MLPSLWGGGYHSRSPCHSRQRNAKTNCLWVRQQQSERERERRGVTGREKKRFVCPNKRTLRGCRRGRAANAARWLRCVRKRSQRNSRKTSTQGAAAAAARGRRLHRPAGQCGLVCTGLHWSGLAGARLASTEDGNGAELAAD